MQYYALIYYVVDDYLTRRAEFREEHLRRAREAHDRDELVLAGAFMEPSDQALLVFRTADRATVEDFVRKDPYVTHGLVQRWEIRSWAVAIGHQPDGMKGG